MTIGLWRSSSSLHGGPSPKCIGGSSPPLASPVPACDPISQLPRLSQEVGGSEKRFCDSLAGVEVPEGGFEGSGSGP